MIVSIAQWGGPNLVAINEPRVFTNRGRISNKTDVDYEFELKADTKADKFYPPLDAHETGKSLLFSSRLRALLCDQGIDNIQYFDSKVTNAVDNKLLDYKVANIIGAVSGLDIEQSDVTLSPSGNVMAINKMVLDESKLKEHNMIRLDEKTIILVVHNDIKQAIEQAGLTGLKFVTDDEFKRGMI